jgi:hypothetical protein
MAVTNEQCANLFLETDHKRASKFCTLIITRMATVRNCQVICDKFNVEEICTSRGYAQEWSLNVIIVKL